MLLRNEGTNGFRLFSFPFVAGRATGGVTFRVVPDTKGMDLAVSYADRKGTLYRDQLRGVYKHEPLEAMPAGARALHAEDIDNDSWIDLAFATPGGAVLALNRNGEFEARTVSGSSPAPLALADVENRGLMDLVAHNAVHRNLGLARLASARTPAGSCPRRARARSCGRRCRRPRGCGSPPGT